MSRTAIWQIEGMECAGCKVKIERILRQYSYIKHVEADYVTGTVRITTENEMTEEEVQNLIGELLEHGYEKTIADPGSTPKQKRLTRQKSPQSGLLDLLLILIILYSIYIILNQAGVTKLSAYVPVITESMGYGMLFIIGLLTSFHCIGMCGGISLIQNVSSQEKHDKHDSVIKKNLLYNLGRILSYTIIGALVGGAGTILSVSIKGKGILSAAAGIFMIIMGLSLMSSSAVLRKLSIRMPKAVVRFLEQKKQGKSSFILGLLNGLMPCGPLQAMQLYALTSGSVIRGALSMFFFSIGTVPLMFLFGLINGKLGKKFRGTILSIQAALVILLGFGMMGNGLALAGIVMPGTISKTTAQVSESIEDGYQNITIYADYGSYENITVQKGIPVRLTLIMPEGKRNGCNNEIVIPQYDIITPLKEGENIITFYPDKEGTYSFSCWMGMIRGIIKVTP